MFAGVACTMFAVLYPALTKTQCTPSLASADPLKFRVLCDVCCINLIPVWLEGRQL